MSRWYGGWAPYVPVAERRRKAERAMDKRRKAGHAVAPVMITGRGIATTFWGRAWCDNMEGYRDYENRLPRGRTYVRNGSVVDLQIAPGRVTAVVSGSELYDVTVTVKATPTTQWRAICADCAGGIDSLVELLQGRFSKAVMERLCRQQGGLFPLPSDIRFACSCPDHAVMCKHVAAVLYGVGARLDHQPELLFRLRAVDENELVAQAGTGLPLSKQAPVSGRVLRTDDVAALFGLDMAAVEPSAEEPRSATARTAPTRPRPSAPPPATPASTARAGVAAGKQPKTPSAATPPTRRDTAKTAAAPKRQVVGQSAPATVTSAAKAAVTRRAAGAGTAGASSAPLATPNSATSGGKGQHRQPTGVGTSRRDASPDSKNTAVPAKPPTSSPSRTRSRTGAAKTTGAAGQKQRPVRWW